MKKIFFMLIGAAVLQSCSKELDKEPFASLTPSKVFQSANNMALYVNSFYVDQIPSANTIAQGDNLSDYVSGNNIPSLMSNTTANNVGGWSWSDLRNINYFLDNYNKSPNIPVATRNSYAGIAKFFRAFFYFDKVKRYGDVPWYSHAIKYDRPGIVQTKGSTHNGCGFYRCRPGFCYCQCTIR